MIRTWDARPDRQQPVTITPDELVVHLREAGATQVYLSRTDSFRDGTISLTATYELPTAEATPGAVGTAERERMVRVFDAIDDRLWFHDREWALTWEVEPVFREPQLDLIPLYERSIEHKHGDGFVLQNLFVVYEEYQLEQQSER